MQPFLSPLVGGATSGGPTHANPATSGERSADPLLEEVPVLEFADIFAADALASAKKEPEVLVSPPLAEADVDTPDLIPVEVEDSVDIPKPLTDHPEEVVMPAVKAAPEAVREAAVLVADIRKPPEHPQLPNTQILEQRGPVDATYNRVSTHVIGDKLQMLNQGAQAASEQQKPVPHHNAQQPLLETGRFASGMLLPPAPPVLAHTPASVTPPAQAVIPLPDLAAPTLQQGRKNATPEVPPQQAAAVVALPQNTNMATTPIVPLITTTTAAPLGQEAADKNAALAVETFTLGRGDGPTATHATSAQPVARADLASHVARQIADVVHHMPARPVEITLSPEELGRVRLSVSTHDTGIVLNVIAERPETMDLLRRHIGQLGEQFQALGYENIAFSFSGGGDAQTSDDTGRNDAVPDDLVIENTDTAPLQIALATGASAGVDIRL